MAQNFVPLQDKNSGVHFNAKANGCRMLTAAKHIVHGIAVGVLAGVMVSCTPRYTNAPYNVDRRIEFTGEKSLDEIVIDNSDAVRKGMEIVVPRPQIRDVHRELRRWIFAIEETEGTVYDPQSLIAEYGLKRAPKAEGSLRRLAEYVREKSSELLDVVGKNRRKHIAKQFNLTLRQRKTTFHIYFVRR